MLNCSCTPGQSFDCSCRPGSSHLQLAVHGCAAASASSAVTYLQPEVIRAI